MQTPEQTFSDAESLARLKSTMARYHIAPQATAVQTRWACVAAILEEWLATLPPVTAQTAPPLPNDADDKKAA